MAAEMNRREIASYDTDAYRRAKEYHMKKFKGMHLTDYCRESDTPLGPAISSHPMISAIVLDEGCQRIGHTPTTVFYAAYAIALAHMSGETRVAFYTMNHGRSDRRLTDHVYGNYLGCLPILVDTDPNQTVGELLSQVHREFFLSLRYRIYPLYHLLRDLGLDDVGTEIGNNTSAILEYIRIDGKLWPTYHIDPSLTGEHSSVVIILRNTQYEVSIDCSSALYTQQQIDELSQLTGDMALLLVDDQEKKLNEIIPSRK